MFDFAEGTRTAWSRPGERERRIALLKAAHASGESQRKRLATRALKGLPKWVPADLADEYRDFTRLYGEEAAASTVRAMKREQMEAANG